MSAIQNQLQKGAVPNSISNVCPQGTKFHVLEVGWLECDEGFVTRGDNTNLKSNEGESFVNKRRQMPTYYILVEHPHDGLILWETGCGKDYPEVCGSAISDIFARVKYEPQHEHRAAVEATGNNIDDIKKIIIGHLHLDHAGGLNEFAGRKDVQPIADDYSKGGAPCCPLMILREALLVTIRVSLANVTNGALFKRPCHDLELAED
ncbi:uncharacterized protein BJX67DRAFT_386592 [Aspergillus lucknowensis]|uniref:Metallo-beta-lactamase domain-containing protein n=1 Tax=Aspergillus lucknowensis TaxID=176173 RepID=A0ABR4L8P0_9EURO